MSHEWIKPAYETRLGNPIAKSVLVLLADQVNGEGFGWPSMDFIVKLTEQNARTVRRVIQIFIRLELVMKVSRGPKRTPGMQLNLALLGTDLRAEFAKYHRASQGSKNGLTDRERTVSQTTKTVSQTAEAVSQTVPPHPLIGRPVNDPLMTLTPMSAYADIPPNPSQLFRELEETQPASGKAEKILETWNRTIEHTLLPQAKRLNPSRAKAINARLKEPGWFAEFEAACRTVAADKRYHGNNRSGWVCDLDFLLQPGKTTQVAEKATSNLKAQRGGVSDGFINRAQQRTNSNLAAFVAAAESIGDHVVADSTRGSETGSGQRAELEILRLGTGALRHERH